MQLRMLYEEHKVERFGVRQAVMKEFPGGEFLIVRFFSEIYPFPPKPRKPRKSRKSGYGAETIQDLPDEDSFGGPGLQIPSASSPQARMYAATHGETMASGGVEMLEFIGKAKSRRQHIYRFRNKLWRRASVAEIRGSPTNWTNPKNVEFRKSTMDSQEIKSTYEQNLQDWLYDYDQWEKAGRPSPELDRYKRRAWPWDSKSKWPGFDPNRKPSLHKIAQRRGGYTNAWSGDIPWGSGKDKMALLPFEGSESDLV